MRSIKTPLANLFLSHIPLSDTLVFLVTACLLLLCFWFTFISGCGTLLFWGGGERCGGGGIKESLKWPSTIILPCSSWNLYLRVWSSILSCLASEEVEHKSSHLGYFRDEKDFDVLIENVCPYCRCLHRL